MNKLMPLLFIALLLISGCSSASLRGMAVGMKSYGNAIAKDDGGYKQPTRCSSSIYGNQIATRCNN